MSVNNLDKLIEEVLNETEKTIKKTIKNLEKLETELTKRQFSKNTIEMFINLIGPDNDEYVGQNYKQILRLAEYYEDYGEQLLFVSAIPNYFSQGQFTTLSDLVDQNLKSTSNNKQYIADKTELTTFYEAAEGLAEAFKPAPEADEEETGLITVPKFLALLSEMIKNERLLKVLNSLGKVLKLIAIVEKNKDKIKKFTLQKGNKTVLAASQSVFTAIENFIKFLSGIYNKISNNKSVETTIAGQSIKLKYQNRTLLKSINSFFNYLKDEETQPDLPKEREFFTDFGVEDYGKTGKVLPLPIINIFQRSSFMQENSFIKRIEALNTFSKKIETQATSPTSQPVGPLYADFLVLEFLEKIIKFGTGGGAQEAGGQFESFIALLCSGTKLGGENEFTDVQVIEEPKGQNYLKIGDLSLKLISANTPNKQSFKTVYEHFSKTDNPMQFLVAIKGGDPRIASKDKNRRISIDLFLSEFTKEDYKQLIEIMNIDGIPKFGLKGDIADEFSGMPTKNASTNKAFFIAPNKEIRYELGFKNDPAGDQKIDNPVAKFGEDEAKGGFLQKGGSNGQVIFKDLGKRIASLLLDGQNMRKTKIKKVDQVNGFINSSLNSLSELNRKLNVFWTKDTTGLRDNDLKKANLERFQDAIKIAEIFEKTSLNIYASFYGARGGRGFGSGRGREEAFGNQFQGLAVKSKGYSDYTDFAKPEDDDEPLQEEVTSPLKILDELILEILQESLDK